MYKSLFTLFTFGFLFMADPPFPKGLAVVPFLWTAIGGSAAILLNMPQDWRLLALLPVAVLLFLRGSVGPGFPCLLSPSDAACLHPVETRASARDYQTQHLYI